jgi:hypothetical protein
MSAKTQPLTDIGKFYKQIGDFKEKLATILSQFNKDQEVIDLNKYYDKLMDFKKINVRAPIELFYQYGVTEFVDDILKRDETIFLGHVSTITEGQEIILPKEAIQCCPTKEVISHRDILFISHIRQIWDCLQPNVKNNIWMYVQVISILAEKIVGGNVLASRREYLKREGMIE